MAVCGSKLRRIIGFLIMACCIGGLVYFLSPYVAGRLNSDYSDYIEDTVTQEREFPYVDWEALKAVNPDVIGWIQIEGTPINYPIVQERQEAPGFYLSHDLEGNYNIYGVPYLDADCKGFNGPLSLVYGHNMIDGTMFAALASYADQGFFDEHKEILLLTPEKNMALEVVCARELSASNESPLIDFTSSNQLTEYLASEARVSSAVSRVPTNVLNVYEFVSCSYGVYNGRTVVYAVDPSASATKY